jgi:AraC-like DNA-binding protein
MPCNLGDVLRSSRETTAGKFSLRWAKVQGDALWAADTTQVTQATLSGPITPADGIFQFIQMSRTRQWNHETMVLTAKKAAEYIDRHGDRYFKITEIASHCECQIKFLNAAFDTVYGGNTKVFLQRYRSARLRGAIKSNPDKSIEELAASCGMPLTPTSKRVFQSLYGISISEFREDCLQQVADKSLVTTKQDCANASDMIKEAVNLKRIEASEKKSGVRRTSDFRDYDDRKVS